MGKADKPIISCVMPTRNRHKLIQDAIRSIVNQTFKEWELIVVDDHSNMLDNTKNVIDSFKDDRIVYKKLSDENGIGIAAARNFGNILARGEFIAVADSDDEYYDYRFEETLKAFKNNNADIVYGDIEIWDYEKKLKIPRSEKYEVRAFDREYLKKYDYIPHPTLAYKKKIVLDFPYSSFYYRAEDYDLLARLAEYNFKFCFVNKPFVKYREHKNSITHKKNLNFDYTEMVKKNRGWIK